MPQQSLDDVDPGFTGMDMRLDPSHLQPGTVAYAENMRFTDGVGRQRPGLRCMNWGVTKIVNGEVIVDPFLVPRAAGVFRDPNDIEVILVAAEEQVYRMHVNNTARVVALPAGEVLGDTVRLIQTFDRVVMLRGSDKPILELVGDTLVWQSVTMIENTITGDGSENPSDGTKPMPNSVDGIYFSNRLVTIHGRDQVAVSDFLNYTRYDPIRGAFRINQGSEDKLTGLASLDQNTLVFFKERSIYLLRNVYGDLSEARLDELTRNYGCIAGRTITKVGNDVVFLSRRGLCSLRVTEQGHIQAVDEPMSKPIQPVIDLIDWTNVDQARCTFHNNKIYLAVPLAFKQQFGALREKIVIQDGFEIQVNGVTINFRQGDQFNGFNNAVLVYDLLSKQWASVDTGTEFSVKEFILAKFSRATRLFFMSNSGWTHLYDDTEYCSDSDEIRPLETAENVYGAHNTLTPITMKMTTRGYLGSQPSRKRFHTAGINYSQRNSKLSITLLGDTPIDKTEMIANRVHSPTRYVRPFDKDPYIRTNENDDHSTEGREDYSVIVRNQTEDGTDDEKSFQLGSNGISTNLMQYYAERKSVRLRGTRLQAQIVNTQGDVKIHSFSVHSTLDDSKTTGSL